MVGDICVGGGLKRGGITRAYCI